MSHDLDRFVRAQEGVHDRALAEIRAGRKETHWMWFVFPQVEGLGSSEMNRFGSPDDLKLRSSATLFAHVSPGGSVFHRLLERFFAGGADERTLDRLGTPDPADKESR